MEFNQLYHTVSSFDIKISNDANKEWATARSYLQSVRVVEELNAPNMFVLELLNWDDTEHTVVWSDKTLFDPGNEVQISLGYQEKIAPVMTGNIVSLEPIFQNGSATLVVRGYDLRYKLLRGKKTRSFADSTDGKIVDTIAKEAQVSVKLTDPGVKLPYVMQHNQTDLAFIHERARRIGYEVYVSDNTLQFQPVQLKNEAGITLTLGVDMLNMFPRLTAVSQPSEVTVQGWDVTKKEAILAKAAVGDELSTMKGKSSGPSTANKSIGKSTFPFVNQPVFSLAEAEKMALGKFNKAALAYIEGEGVCYGRPDLKVGTVVNLEGMGERFSGQYYITSVKHIWRNKSGYRTRFTYKRNAA